MTKSSQESECFKERVKSRTNVPKRSFRNFNVSTGELLGFRLVLGRAEDLGLFRTEAAGFVASFFPVTVVVFVCDDVCDDVFVVVSVRGGFFVGTVNAGKSGPSALDTEGAGAAVYLTGIRFTGLGTKRGKPTGLAEVVRVDTHTWGSATPQVVRS